MLKNQEFVGVVDRLGSNGEGIIKDGNYTVFVPYALPNEKIKYKVLKVKATPNKTAKGAENHNAFGK